MTDKLYKTRSAAIRAAKDACKKVVGPIYEAKEGPDFEIHPTSIGPWVADKRWKFKIRVSADLVA